ncbi:YeiH family protein [Marinobacter litoralis]|uniref:YeiH family protein n=1 Tax=Marinobacter litoralis TaxID=187981 RepID=UPI0018EC9294|nr:YeiH family protein [Marinobacter litoralis]MBJ6137063.1 YeiH family putative sulfate export transporter [Marinobacter litoralis]
MFRGLGVCVVLTLAGYGIGALPPVQKTGLGPLVFTLILGLVAGNLRVGKQLEGLTPGLGFASRWLLRAGIVLFGFSLTVQQLVGLGPMILVLDTLVVLTITTVGYWLGTRWLKLDRDTAILTSAGSAICGAAAVLATEGAIRARPAATSMAVATVVLFGTLAMFIYPVMFPLLGWDEGLYGIYIGSTVHEVAQVVAAGNAVGEQAMANAVIVKLVRVMLLVPFLLVIGQIWSRSRNKKEGTATTASKITVPWFAFGFVAVVCLNSLLDLPNTAQSTLVLAGQIAMTMAMAALGFQTRIEALRHLGMKPFVLASLLFVALLVGGAVVTPALIG